MKLVLDIIEFFALSIFIVEVLPILIPLAVRIAKGSSPADAIRRHVDNARKKELKNDDVDS